MPGNITTPINLGNGARLIFGKYIFDDDAQTFTWPVELQRSVAAGSQPVCSFALVITNTFSTLVSRQNTPPTGVVIGDVNAWFIVGTRATPTGYTDAWTVMRAATNTSGGRRTALETHVGSAGAGHIDASLAYT